MAFDLRKRHTTGFPYLKNRVNFVLRKFSIEVLFVTQLHLLSIQRSVMVQVDVTEHIVDLLFLSVTAIRECSTRRMSDRRIVVTKCRPSVATRNNSESIKCTISFIVSDY